MTSNPESKLNIGDIVIYIPERQVLEYNKQPMTIEVKNYSSKDGKWAYKALPFNFFWEDEVTLFSLTPKTS